MVTTDLIQPTIPGLFRALRLHLRDGLAEWQAARRRQAERRAGNDSHDLGRATSPRHPAPRPQVPGRPCRRLDRLPALGGAEHAERHSTGPDGPQPRRCRPLRHTRRGKRAATVGSGPGPRLLRRTGLAVFHSSRAGLVESARRGQRTARWRPRGAAENRHSRETFTGVPGRASPRAGPGRPGSAPPLPAAVRWPRRRSAHVSARSGCPAGRRSHQRRRGTDSEPAPSQPAIGTASRAGSGHRSGSGPRRQSA
jgi:hypothetical protein